MVIHNMPARRFSLRYNLWLDRCAKRGGKMLGFDKPKRNPHAKIYRHRRRNFGLMGRICLTRVGGSRLIY